MPTQKLTPATAIRLTINLLRSDNVKEISNKELQQFLKEYVGLELSPEELGRCMTRLGYTRESGLKVMIYETKNYSSHRKYS